MEHEVLLTGIGGQGVQLAGSILALAATREGREVMSLGTYGGTMRGGSTDASIVIADTPILSPPIVSEAGNALAMHHAFFAPVAARLRPGALVLCNSTVFDTLPEDPDLQVLDLPATRLATEQGNPMAAALVLLGGFCALRELVSLESLVAAMEEAVPSYRRQHVDGNTAALRCGYAAMPRGSHPAWPREPVSPLSRETTP